MIKNKKAFTLIELIVTIAVLGILVLLASPRFFGHTQNAELTKGFANARTIEKASELYYMDNNDWPRLTDEPYTSEEIESYSERIFNHTGQEINLDPEGKYYDIDYDKLSDYIQVPDDKKNYILQNPVGKVFYMENLNETGKSRVNYNQVVNNDEDVIEEDTFEFTATFTNAGSTGRTGPTQSQLDNAYAGTALEGLVSSQNGIQLWTVPQSGIYRIEAYGAQGGDYSNRHDSFGGRGALIKGDLELNENEMIKILVGQRGTSYANSLYGGAGGGGGTFVVNSEDKPLLIAGGGSGAAGGSGKNDGQDGSLSTTGTNGLRRSGNAIGAPGGENGAAGALGEGLNGQKSIGGAGFYGTPISNDSQKIPPKSFINGGQGGLSNKQERHADGGFGGGSAGDERKGGAAGGYSGGGGLFSGSTASDYGTGGGGGSFNSGANQENSVGNTGHGKVIITYIGK